MIGEERGGFYAIPEFQECIKEKRKRIQNQK